MENRIYEYLSVFIMAWLFVYGLTPFIIRLASALNFVDKPEARKIHLKNIPLLGGLSVATGFVLLCIYDVLITPGRYLDKPMLGYLAGSIIIVLIGIIDDHKGMKPAVKLAGQIAVSLLFIGTNFTVGELGLMFGRYTFSLPIMLLWMVGLMNALNFLDNMDGIISGMAGILGLGFLLLLCQYDAGKSGSNGFDGIDCS